MEGPLASHTHPPAALRRYRQLEHDRGAYTDDVGNARHTAEIISCRPSGGVSMGWGAWPPALVRYAVEIYTDFLRTSKWRDVSYS